MGKVIAVVSGKGGTGKTTTVAAVSSCLAAMGHKTLCIDCDAGLRNLDIALCMSDYAVSDFSDVVSGEMSLSEAARKHPKIDGLWFLAAPPVGGAEDFNENELASLIDEARKNFDFCLIDSPSGVGAGFRLAVSQADMALIVATGEMTSVRDAQRAAELTSGLGVAERRLVINRVKPGDYKRIKSTLDDVIDAVGVRLIGVVCEDRAVMYAPHDNIPLILYPRRRAAHSFLAAARRIAGENVPMKKY